MGVISSEKYTRTLKSLANRRVVAVFFLGFASGLPLALAGGTLQACAADHRLQYQCTMAEWLTG